MTSETITYYPNTVTQATGSNNVAFTGLTNLRNSNKTYAKTGTIGASTATKNQPSSITATNFKINLPTGAEIQKIRVEVRHQQSKNVNIPKPTVTLVNTTGGEANTITAPSTTKTEQAFRAVLCRED